MLPWKKAAKEYRRAFLSMRDEFANPDFHHFDLVQGKWEIYLSQPQGRVVGYILAAITQMFDDAGAKNNVELVVSRSLKAGGGEYLITFQKANHPTPAEQRRLAEYRAERLQTAMERAIAILRIYENSPASYATDILQQALDFEKEAEG